jgi:hypothetical protein
MSSNVFALKVIRTESLAITLFGVPVFCRLSLLKSGIKAEDQVYDLKKDFDPKARHPSIGW